VTGPAPYPIGDIRQFRFTSVDDGWSTVLRVRIAYSHRRIAADSYDSEEFATGCAFVDVGEPEVERQVDGLIARASGIISFPVPR
jgi:hypothetical protein